MKRFLQVLSWIFALRIAQVFLISLTFKFTGAPETVHIFGTIGQWISETISQPVGSLFSQYGAYGTGVVELLVSLLLLLPALLWVLAKLGLMKKAPAFESFHSLGGLLAALVMAGAVSFHLITPLGIEVLYQGQSDGGSLFYNGVSILVMGILMFVMNGRTVKLEC